MSEPVIAKKGPFVIELKPGTYWYCTCGQSKKQPFCDGSHPGSGFEPLEFVITELKKYGFCGCKHSKGMPFCDGSHKEL